MRQNEKKKRNKAIRQMSPIWAFSHILFPISKHIYLHTNIIKFKLQAHGGKECERYRIGKKSWILSMTRTRTDVSFHPCHTKWLNEMLVFISIRFNVNNSFHEYEYDKLMDCNLMTLRMWAFVIRFISYW